MKRTLKYTTSIMLLTLLLTFAPSAAAKSGAPVRVRVKKKRGKVPPGGAAVLRVKVKNRTRESIVREVTLSWATGDTIATRTVELGPKDRERFEVAAPVPDGTTGGKLTVVATCGSDESRTKVRVKAAPGTGAANGRDLFLSSCAGCHGQTGSGLRGEDFSGWKAALRRGPGSMPRFPDLTSDDIRAMRAYVKNPGVDPGGDPGVPPGNPTDPADENWLHGKDLFLANCAGCHGDVGSDIRREDFEDWWEAVSGGEGEREDDDEGEGKREGRMPAFPGLTATDVRHMREYVLDPNRNVNEPPPPPPPPPPPGGETPTYEGAVKAILDASCVACHGSGTAFAGVRLNDYTNAFSNRTALVDSVEKNRMPTGSPLDSAKKATLRAWLDGGAPEK